MSDTLPASTPPFLWDIKPDYSFGTASTSQALSSPKRVRRGSKNQTLVLHEPSQDMLLTSSAAAKLGRRRSTLTTLSNASNEHLELRRASVGSLVSNFDLLTALQQPPATLMTDRRGRMDLKGALMVAPEDVLLETGGATSRRTSTVSVASNASGVAVDLLQALRAGPALAHRRPIAPLTPVSAGAPAMTPRSSTSSHSGAPSSSVNTAAPLLYEGREGRRGSTPADVLSIRSQPRTEAQSAAAAAAFGALRRRVTGSRSEIASQLLEELAAAAAEHACAPTSSTARELDQVAQEVADSHGVGPALNAALSRAGYPPLALCTPSDAARLWRDLKGVDLAPPHSPTMESSENDEDAGGRSEELLDEGRKRWLSWRAAQTSV